MFDMLVKGVFFFSLKRLSRWDIIFNMNLFLHGLDNLFSCFFFSFLREHDGQYNHLTSIGNQQF